MPDYSSDYIPVPSIQKHYAPLSDNGISIAKPDMNTFNSVIARVTQEAPDFVKNGELLIPYKTRLDETLRYTDPDIGFNPFDGRLEYKYADAHPVATFRNNIVSGGARFLGAALEAIGTIPIAINAASNKDFSKLYNNDFTNSIHDFLDTLNTELPTYRSEYEDEHPILKYLNPLKLGSFAGAWGGAVNNFGYTAGAIAGALVEDAVITALTGGAGLFPALAANATQIVRGLSRASKVVVESGAEVRHAMQLVKAADNSLEAVEGTLRGGVSAGRELALTGQAGKFATGTGMKGQSINNFAENIAATGVKKREQIIKNAYTYFKHFRDPAKYHLALLTSAAAEGAFEAADVRHNAEKELRQQFFDIYGHDASPGQLESFKRQAVEAANLTMGANIALLYLTNRLNWGSLFKPTKSALKEGIIGWGRNISRSKVTGVFDDKVGDFVYDVSKNVPSSRIGKVLLNGEKLLKIGAEKGLVESFEEGAQFTFSQGSVDYILNKYNADNRQQVGDYMSSFLKGIDDTFNTNEGLDNLMGGFIGGIFGGAVMNRVIGGGSVKDQLNTQAKLMNRWNLKGSMEDKMQEVANTVKLAQDHKQAVEAKDTFAAKNFKFKMLFNWVASGVRANAYESRMSELDDVRGFTDDKFEKYWDVEYTPENVEYINNYLDGVKSKAAEIKKDVERVDYLTKNPYNRTKSPLDYNAYESYKDLLALNLSQSREYRRRMESVQNSLRNLAPGLDIQKAVYLTSLQGIRQTMDDIQSNIDQLGLQIKEAQGNEELVNSLYRKHQSLTDILRRLQPLVLNTKVSEEGETIESAFNGKEYVEALQDLFDLYNGIDLQNNKYIERKQKLLGEPNTIYIDGQKEATDSDKLADALEQLQDLRKLAEANFGVERYYHYLRTGKGADEFLKNIKNYATSQMEKIIDQTTGSIKPPEQVEEEVEEQIRFEQGFSQEAEDEIKDDENGSKEEKRENIRKAAKKVVKNQKLTSEEEDLAENHPTAFAHEVKIQQKVKKVIDELLNGVISEVLDSATSSNVSSNNVLTVHDVFGMFSQDKNDMTNRTNLYNAIFNSTDGVFNKIKAVFGLVEPENVVYTKIGKTELYRKSFEENLTITHNNIPIGILRPPTSVYLDAAGERSIFDLKEDEYEKITGNPKNTYSEFMNSLRAYRDSYNKLKAEIEEKQEAGGEVTYQDIAKYFSLSINTGSRKSNTNPANDVILRNLEYKPLGTALISVTLDTIEVKNGVSQKVSVPTIVNRSQLSAEQIAELEKFLETNKDLIAKNINRYAIVVPVLGKYVNKGIIFARNANTDNEEKTRFYNTIKEVASGVYNEDENKINELINNIASEFFLANTDRTTKQVFVNLLFDLDGNTVIHVFNNEKGVNKYINIPKEVVQKTQNYAELINAFNNEISKQESNDRTFASLKLTITQDSLKRQLPKDENITDLKQVEDKLQLAISNPQVFENFNINFTPIIGGANSGSVGTTPSPTEPTLPTDLSKSNPTYNYGSHHFDLEFETDIDKAAFISAQKTKSKRDADFVKFVMQHTNLTEEQVRELGRFIKEDIKHNAKLLIEVNDGESIISVDKTYDEFIKNQTKDEVEPEVVYVENKEELTFLLGKYFGLTQEQAEASADIFERVAQTWATRTGRPMEEFFQTLGFGDQELFNQNYKIGDPNTLFSKEQLTQIDKEVGELKEQGVKYPENRNLLEDIWYKTQTPTFKKWFGDSKAVDEYGDPIVYFHGTTENWEVFDKESAKLKSRGFRDQIYLTQEYDFANDYTKQNGNILSLFVKTSKPFDYENQEHLEDLKYNGPIGAYTDLETRLNDIKENNNWDILEDSRVQEFIKNQGYDGFYIKEQGIKNLAVYEPNQIKRLNSKGFDTNNDNINYQINDIQKIIKGFELQPVYSGSLFVGFRTKNDIANRTIVKAIYKWSKENDLNVIPRYNLTYGTIELVAVKSTGVLFQLDAWYGSSDAKAAYDKLKQIIYALTNPNVSSPIHELAHFWHGITEGKDKNTLLTDEEIKQVLEWAKTSEWTTETSEAFAKGFETYLAEGKAPSPELENVFQKFAKWLAEIYKDIKQALGIELNDNMRQIYARMLNSQFISDSVSATIDEANNIQKEENKSETPKETFDKNPYRLTQEANIDMRTSWVNNEETDYFIIDNNGKKLILKPYSSYTEAVEALNGINTLNGFGINEQPEQTGEKLPKDITLEDIKQELSKYATVKTSPISGHLIVNDNVQLDINQVDGSWHIISITSLEKNKGYATKAMGAIVQAADNLNIVLQLEATPLDPSGLTKAQLVDFYKKFGFTVTTDQYGMDNEADILEYTLNSEREPVEMARLPKDLQEQEFPKDAILSQNQFDIIKSNVDSIIDNNYTPVNVYQNTLINPAPSMNVPDGDEQKDIDAVLNGSKPLFVSDRTIDKFNPNLNEEGLIKKEFIWRDGRTSVIFGKPEYVEAFIHNQEEKNNDIYHAVNGLLLGYDIDSVVANMYVGNRNITLDDVNNTLSIAEDIVNSVLYNTEDSVASETSVLSQQEIDFINILKDNSSELKGIYGNVIKDMLDAEDYVGVVDLMRSQFVDDTSTAKSILGDTSYNAFLELTGVQDGSSNVDEILGSSPNIEDVVEPDIEEQPAQKSEAKYVFYKENVDGKIETNVGRVVSQEGVITTIERNGIQFDRLSDTLSPATEQEYKNSNPEEATETSKYKKGDKVVYGQDKGKYTITGSKQIKLEDNINHTFYTTEEGVDILESGIHGYARLEPVQRSLAVKREHETRRRILDRIGKRLQALFPQIKYEIGYFDFNAPARFNHGVVEINVGYGDRKYTQAEINALEDNDIFNVPWLKRESVAHEFMHPFIEAVKISNKPLYNNLAKEILNKADIMAHVDSLIKSGTYNESDRIDEAIAIFLGREITRAFDKSGIINREYIRNRKNNLVRRFLKWLNDVIDYITGRNKPYSLDEFIQKANTGVKYTEKNIRGVVNKKDKNGKFVYPDLDKLYKKHMDNSSFIRALNKELNILGNENFAEKYGITSKRDLDTLLTNIDDYITGNNKGNIIFGKRTNLKSTVEFEETDDNKLYVYIDPSGLNEISAPSFLTAFSNRIVDNELAKEYEKVINDNFYRKTKDKKDSKVMGVDALNPIMKLQDISDFLISQLDQDTASIESIEYTGYELSAIDELEKYMELSEPEAKKIRERVMRNWKGLQDIATKRLNNEDLKIQSNVIRRLDLDSQNDIEFVLRYTQQAAQAINLAVRKYGKLREELKSPGLTQAKLNRLNKELEVIKQLVSFYDEFNKLYSLYDESFNDADKIKFLKATSSLQYIRDSMANTAIDLTLEWLMPYIDKHNAELKKLGYSEKYMTTRQMMYNNLKFGTNKDTNFITFNLGTNVESRDPVNAAFANTISDNRSLQTLHIQNDTTELNIAYDNFLKENNISSVNYGAQIEFYKKHYYRQAEVLVFKIDEITGEKTEEYITKTALHQEFFFDKYEKDLSEVKKKYSNPRSGIEAEEFDTKIIEWQRANSFGKSEKYRNPEYHKLNSDKFFKVIENFYNINNAKYGENALNFGIIPQKYDANIIDKLQDFVKGVKAGKNVEEQYQFVKDKIVSSAAGMKKDNTSINLDGTVYRRIKTELTSMKQEKNISFDIKNVIEGFISEATDYSAMRDIQYNAETLRMLIEGNVKFSVPSRLIGKENFNARIKDDLTMGKVKSKFKELKDLKDAGLSYDKDLYEKLEEKIKKGVEKKSLWDDFLPRLKPSGTDMLNKMLIQQMNDFFYGDAVEDQKIGKISATKAAHYVSLYTSLVNMGLNWKAAISNINIGNLQLFIEGHGGKYFNKKELSEAIADYIKNIPNYARDLQVPIKSKDTQLAMLLDAIQGEVFDENRNRVTGSIAKRMFTVNNLFLLTNLGEHQIQITGMKAMLKGRKVETKNGEKITLYDAYTADKNGRYSLRTDLKDFTQEDLQKFIRELHGVNRNLNGNYSDLHKTTLARKWYGTLLLKFRKYLYPAFRSRFASEHIDYERNIVETGYLRFFFKDYLFGGLKRIIREHTIKGFSKEGFTEQEKYQFRKAIFELSSYAALTVLGMALGGGFSDDDKKKEISDFQKYLLYFTLRLRSDVGMYHVDMPSEFIRQIKNPTASLTAIVNGMGFIGQLWSPTEVYEKDSGTHEAGDSKLWAKAQKLIPVYNKFLVNIDDQLGYFNLINRNIEGVSPKRSTP